MHYCSSRILDGGNVWFKIKRPGSVASAFQLMELYGVVSVFLFITYQFFCLFSFKRITFMKPFFKRK